MENGAAGDAPRAVWLGRVAAVMEARGDRDEAVRLYGEAAAALTGGDTSCHDGSAAAGDNSRPRRRDGGGNGEISVGARANGDSLAARVRAGVGAGVQAATTVGWSGSRSGSQMGHLFPYSARAHHLASMIERSYRRHFNRWCWPFRGELMSSFLGTISSLFDDLLET